MELDLTKGIAVCVFCLLLLGIAGVGYGIGVETTLTSFAKNNFTFNTTELYQHGAMSGCLHGCDWYSVRTPPKDPYKLDDCQNACTVKYGQ